MKKTSKFLKKILGHYWGKWYRFLAIFICIVLFFLNNTLGYLLFSIAISIEIFLMFYMKKIGRFSVIFAVALQGVFLSIIAYCFLVWILPPYTSLGEDIEKTINEKIGAHVVTYVSGWSQPCDSFLSFMYMRNNCPVLVVDKNRLVDVVKVLSSCEGANKKGEEIIFCGKLEKVYIELSVMESNFKLFYIGGKW